MSSQLRSLFEATRRIGSLPDLGPGRLLAESVPLAAVVAFWSVIGAVVGGGVNGTAVRFAGAVMAGAYALVRGWQVVSDDDGTALPRTARSLVGASVPPAIVCLAWIAGAVVLEMVVVGLWQGLYGILPLERAQGLALAFVDVGEFTGAATAFLAVLLYAAAFVRTYAVADAAAGPSTGGAGAAAGDD